MATIGSSYPNLIDKYKAEGEGTVIELLKQNKIDDVLVVVGGTIPEQDIDFLKKAGVAGIFGPGTLMEDIITFIKKNVRQRSVPA